MSSKSAEARKAALELRVREELERFDGMPDDAFVRLPVTCALYGWSPATTWRRVRLKEFPAPVKLSEKMTAWRVGDLRVHSASLRSSVGKNSPGTQRARDALAAKRSRTT
jgi:predicted DNA-binding transcriptional regulator AlpA